MLVLVIFREKEQVQLPKLNPVRWERGKKQVLINGDNKYIIISFIYLFIFLLFLLFFFTRTAFTIAESRLQKKNSGPRHGKQKVLVGSCEESVVRKKNRPYCLCTTCKLRVRNVWKEKGWKGWKKTKKECSVYLQCFFGKWSPER